MGSCSRKVRPLATGDARIIVLAVVAVLPSVVANWASGGECCNIRCFNGGSWLMVELPTSSQPIAIPDAIEVKLKGLKIV
tara:strand:+ start:4605 stop:4844 length:240 start_codon:yes stop_codon:yes gene_type:complete